MRSHSFTCHPHTNHTCFTPQLKGVTAVLSGTQLVLIGVCVTAIQTFKQWQAAVIQFHHYPSQNWHQCLKIKQNQHQRLSYIHKCHSLVKNKV